MSRKFGPSVVTGLARLDGWPVAVVASDPAIYGGAWTADSAQKLTRFIDLAHTFHLPVVHLVDIPGFMIGPDAEKAGTIRHGARALAAVYQAQVPWCSILLRKVFGVAGAAHTNHARLHYRYAWPSGDWGSLPIEGGIEAAYRADLAAAEDPAALRTEIETRLNRVRLALPHGRSLHGRGDHRSARHPEAAVRIRAAGSAAAQGGAGGGADAAVIGLIDYRAGLDGGLPCWPSGFGRLPPATAF
ncbi:MAG: carboxyl transferase domain-containing protein [Aliidongia sp.]